jgi:hypothetical protein
MERRRAIAWIGSIAVTGCASALLLSSLLGEFGLTPLPAQDTQVVSPHPEPRSIEPEPAPGSAAPIETEPHSPTSDTRLPARIPIRPFRATADTSDAPTPQVGLEIPCATLRCSPHANEVPSARVAASNPPEPTIKPSSPVNHARAVQPAGSDQRWEASTTPPKVDTIQPGDGVLDQPVRQPQSTSSPSEVDTMQPGGDVPGRHARRPHIISSPSKVGSGLSVERDNGSMLGRSSGAGGKMDAGRGTVGDGGGRRG